MTSGNDTYGKAPILNPGEYDWWVRDIEAHICSGDSQVWGIVKRGPLPIKDPKNPTEEKNEAEYTDEDHRKNEKNLRAKRILLSALSPADKRKIMKYDTAHEIWKALARLYGGNTDIKRNRILAASNEYENTIQGNAESLEEFHSRFQTCLGQLEFLGEVIPEWKVTHHFLQSLNSKWDSVSMALQAQSNIKEISLEDLVAYLQSQSVIVERKLARR